MSKRIYKISRAMFGLCWLCAGTGCNSATPSTASSASQDESKACVTLAMSDRQSASIDMNAREVLLEIPGALEMQGRMTGAVVVVDFNRPKYGKLGCRYEQEADGALTLRSCDEDAGRGDLVTSDRMSLRVQSPGDADDVMVTACANRAGVPGPLPEARPLEDFPILANGDVVRPEGEGQPVISQPVPFGMTGELELEYRATAERNPAVKRLLGARFAYSYLETIDPEKGHERDSVHVKLWFFSHTNTMAVWAQMKDGVVEDSGESNIAIPEGADEIEEAVDLARRDPALRGHVNDLLGGGMLKVSVEGAAWEGHRVLEVHFGNADHVAQYRALVDLTDERVLEAGPVDLH